MKAKGVSSIVLAENVGVSKATVSYWLNGKVFPTPETLEKIAQALNVPLWQLFASQSDIMNGEEKDIIVCPNCGKKFKMED